MAYAPLVATTETSVAAAQIDFGQALGHLLRAYQDGARVALAELPGGPRGYQVLATAAANQCSSQAQMAERIGIDRTIMTYLIDELEGAGLVVRRPDPTDRRARRVELTPEGAAALRQADGAVKQVERNVLRALSDGDASNLRAHLVAAVADAPVERVDACADAEALPA